MVATLNYGLSTDITLGGNSPSDIISPSEKAIKTYVDNHAGLPSQAGNAGKFLTTNGTLASWATIDIPPEVTEATVSGWGFTKNTGTVTSVNNVQPVGGNVTLSIPTDTADLTNGAGFITSSALNGYATETWVGEQGFLTSVPDATTSSKGLVQPDGTTVTINNGVISANASVPSNMVTTDTQQTISGIKSWSNQQFFNGNTTFDNAATHRFEYGYYLGSGNSNAAGGKIYAGDYGTAFQTWTRSGSSTNGMVIDQLGSLNSAQNNELTIRRFLGSGTIDNGVVNIWSGNTEAASSTKFKLDKNGVFVNDNKVLDASSVDGTTITYNSTTGKISAASSEPTNMVTTDTAQTISGAKTFSLAAGTIFQNSNNTNGSAKLGVYDTSSYRGGILLENNYQAYRYYPSLTFGYNGYGMTSNAHITMYANSSSGGPLCIANGTSGVINIGPASPSTSGTYTGLRIKADGTLLEYNNNSILTSASVDGTTITYDSSTGKISAAAATAWGDITGTLSNQTDLQNALNAKQDNITSSAMLSSDLVDDTGHTHKFATATQLSQIATNTTNISTINGKIPAEATTTNQLADKAFVNSSIATNTANFIGTFNSVAELEAYTGTLTNNDYAFVATTDTAGNTLYDRYKYNAGTQEWLFEYELNNSSFTAAQWGSINSGITSSDVSLIGTALQPNDNVSELNNDAGYITSSALSNLANKDLSNLSTTGNSKFQAPLVSGTNIKTVNGNSLLGSGNISIDSLPSQSGNAGKFLTTNGTAASWADTTKVTFRDWSVA